MSYLSLIFKNPFRNKTRSALAIIGIAIGIATIVALGIVTDGLKASTENTLKSGGSDFTVTEANSPGLGSSSINEDRISDIKKMNGLKNAVGVLITNRAVDGQLFTVMGINQDDLEVGQINIIDGNAFAADKDEIIIGKTASQNLNKKVGDSVNIYGKEFQITEIFETGSVWEDGGSFVSLGRLQELADKDNKVSMIFVKLANSADIDAVTKAIEDAYPEELTTVKSIEDFNKVNKGLETIDTAAWAISLLAILIGGIGVVNTMVMSVYERTREIGVLKAVGWKDKRILGMILGESVVLTVLAALIGIIMGIIAVELILTLPSMGGYIKPVYSIELFFKAVGIALFVGIVGGLYPALRAARLKPTEALRYE
ncbi:MAG: ABC transporter permease [Methanobacterium sp.]